MEYYHLSVSQKKKARKIIEKDSAAEAVTNRDVFAVKSEAEKQKSPQDKKQENIALLTPPAAEVYAKMSPSPMGMEDLRRNTGLLAHQLFPILTELELNNLVEALPGGRYRKL